MPEPAAALTAFVRAYEQATNSHDITQVAPLIAPEAVYWFSDGSHRGRQAILAAIAETFATIQDESYRIDELEWIASNASHAICRYRFTWTGTINQAATIRHRPGNQRAHQQRRNLADAARTPQRIADRQNQSTGFDNCSAVKGDHVNLGAP